MLQGEAQGLYTNIRRPSNKSVKIDFEIDSLEGYTYVDYKTPIDFTALAKKKRVDMSGFPSPKIVGYNMGTKILDQKKRYCSIADGPKSPENVLHVINLDLVNDPIKKQAIIEGVLNGAERNSNTTTGIYFLNYED